MAQNKSRSNVMESAFGRSKRMQNEEAWKRDVSRIVLENMGKEEMINKMKDITIKVGDKSYPCHKAVLASVSPFFFAMFSDGFSEETQEEIELKSVSSEVFEGILKILYLKKDPITAENVEDYLKAASCLQIEILQERCEKVVKENLDKSNAIGVWKLSKVLGCENLEETCWQMILKCFIDMTDEDEFNDLDKDDLIRIIKDPFLDTERKKDGITKHLFEPHLKVQKEEFVLHAVLFWIQKDPDQRLPYMKDFLPHIKVPLMSPDSILTFMDTYPHLYLDKDCRYILNEAQRYHMLPQTRTSIDSRRIELRDSCSIVDALVLLQASDTLHSMGYSLLMKYWFELSTIPEKLGKFYAVCKDDNNLYVSGGTSGFGNFFKYSASEDNWTRLPQVKPHISKHCMASNTKDVFILGGKTDLHEVTNVVRKFSKGQNTWTNYGYLTVPVNSASSVILDDSVFVIGGKSKEEEETVLIQMYDIMSSQCTIIAQLLEPVSITGAFLANDRVYMKTPVSAVVLAYNRKSSSMDIVSVKEYENLDVVSPTSAYYGGLWYITSSSEDQPIFTINMSNLEKESKEKCHLNPSMYSVGHDRDVQMVRMVIPKKHIKRP